MKQVKYAIRAKEEAVGNKTIHRAIPNQYEKKIGPFMLLDHMGPWEISSGNGFNVPDHPHAGIQTVTYFIDGEGLHKDSLGREQLITPGDVNWMTSGRGIVHSEQSSPEFTENGGIINGFQLWVDLPSDKRQIEPDFGSFTRNDLPLISLDKGALRVVAGQYKDVLSPVKSFTPLHLFHYRAWQTSELELQLPVNQESAIYVAKGGIEIDGKTYDQTEMIVLSNTGEKIELSIKQDAHIIIFGGEKQIQPSVSYGPFVMNSMKEIQQTIDAYQRGEMGTIKSENNGSK